MQVHFTESQILLFLIQIALLLGMARALGELFRRWGQPSITAEILVGIMFGPTIFGRALPTWSRTLFPPEAAQMYMLETVAWLGILFFLLKAGLETNFATAWNQRRKAATLSFFDLTVPMLIAFVPCYFLPERYMGGDGSRLAFALFIATIMTISALPVTARILQDLKVYRTDIGLLIMSALTINDVAGWIVFALILGFFTEATLTAWTILFLLGATLSFAAVCLSLGPRAFDATVTGMRRLRVPEPAGSLTLVVVVGLVCGAITTWIGIHALFGFFIAGIMAGESKLLSENTRHIFSELVHAILVPLFFASIGLKLDFFGDFDILLVLFFLGLGIAGRFAAAYLGARIIGQLKEHSTFTAQAHIPGGEMQIVIGMLALEYSVITNTVYVAVVFGAIATSMIAGPWMKKTLRKVEEIDWLAYLPLDNIHPSLEAEGRDGVIREMSLVAARLEGTLDAETIEAAVLAREGQMSTALGDGIAVPHARLQGLARPLLVLGRHPFGADWNAQDDKPVRLAFLILTNEDDLSTQLRFLRGISAMMGNRTIREEILTAAMASDILSQMRMSSTRIPRSS